MMLCTNFKTEMCCRLHKSKIRFKELSQIACRMTFLTEVDYLIALWINCNYLNLFRPV